MNYRLFNDANVAEVGLGTWQLGGTEWGDISEKESLELLRAYVEAGGNFIDTAEMYPVPPGCETQGLTEKYIGTWLKNRSDRDQIILASKVAGPSSGLKYIRDPLGFKPQQIREALENSLKRLQTDYIDLYQLHWPGRKVNNFGKLGLPELPEDLTIRDTKTSSWNWDRKF
jgi:aryl-alcohol dehydrogenase-like predicted oxidoreductase